MIFSKEQLIDAGGVIQEASSVPGLVFEEGVNASSRFPTFSEIKALYIRTEQQVPEQAGSKASRLMLPKRSEELQKYNGATVIVGIKNRSRDIFLPGKVLPDGQVGLLATKVAARSKERITDNISDIEALMLTKFYLEHLSDLEHEEGSANVAKIGMGVLVAAAKSSAGLHGVVHSFESTSLSLPSQILANSATNNLSIPTSHGDYPLGFRVFNPEQTAGIEVFADHQFPELLLGNNSFELTAGVTKTIRDLQGAPAQLHANAAALLEPLH